jgi:hypothetical protein
MPHRTNAPEPGDRQDHRPPQGDAARRASGGSYAALVWAPGESGTIARPTPGRNQAGAPSRIAYTGTALKVGFTGRTQPKSVTCLELVMNCTEDSGRPFAASRC